MGNWIPLQKCIASEKTYPKFDPAQPNLLVVADDLKVNLHDCPEHVEIALYNTHPGYGCMGFFTSSAFANLGGIGIFRAISVGRGIEYEFRVFDNPFALPTAKLPDSILRFTKKATGIVRDTYTGLMTRLIQF